MTVPFIPELDVPFVFRRRPTSVPPDLRPVWRVNLVVLLLRKCCHRNRSSFARLHLLSWATLSAENREALLGVVDGQHALDSLIVRVEPSLNRAVDYTIGEGLIRRVDGDRLELTPAGITMANEVDHSEECLVMEKEFMNLLGRRVTETIVNNIFGQRG